MRLPLIPLFAISLPLLACAQSPKVTTPTSESFAAPAVKVATIPRKPAPAVAAPRVIVVDYASGRVLYEKNADAKCAVASTQKLMTALCVWDKGNVQKRFTIAKSDTWVEPTKLGILPGQVYTRRVLLGALLVKSGNDVARALARDNAGSEAKFATVMNAKARSLGMKNSNFLNPHGLTAKGQYSTARDMSICARAAYANSTFRGIMNTRDYNFKFSNGKTRHLTNTNKVLKRLKYCNGMKTGTTRASGRCLISSGELNGRTAIVVVLGATTATVWNDSEKLLRWALERPASQ